MDRTDTKPADRRRGLDDDDVDMDREQEVPDWLVGGGTPPGLQTPHIDPDGGAAVGTEPELQERPLPGPGDHPAGA